MVLLLKSPAEAVEVPKGPNVRFETFKFTDDRSHQNIDGQPLTAHVTGGMVEVKAGDIVLLDVTPLNLGIETMGNVLTTLVESNTTIPCKKTMTFSNAQDMQSMASIMV